MLVLPACRNASATASSSPAPSASAPAVVAVPTTPPAAAIAPKDDILALFRHEAQNRPAAGPHVEDVIAAFGRAGLATSNLRQHLAKPFGAAYCAGAESGRDVVLSLCEYGSVEAATAGRAASLEGLATVANRSVVQNGSLTLTLRERAKSRSSASLVGQLTRVFSAVTR